MDDKIKTVFDIKRILDACRDLDFKNTDKENTYKWINGLLKKFCYFSLSKKQKGVLKRYIVKMTGYSDRQVKRLIKRYFIFGEIIINKNIKRNKFKRIYNDDDINLLIKTDNLHNRLNGLATKKIYETEYFVYHKAEFERLSKISIAHIYNIRKTKIYYKKCLVYTKTNPKKVNIGERKKPAPEGKPGYIRVDSVHQGDSGKQKGVYYINAIDEVTQWEIVVSTERIAERYLLDALIDLINQFPFEIIEFHSDNGSEYINKQVVTLLNKLLITLTKSRTRQCNDNALVEAKNGAVIRKWMGYAYISQNKAEKINIFLKKHFNIYLNYYRPSIFPEVLISNKNKEVKTYKYKNTMTPFSKLKSVKNYEIFLKENFSIIDTESFLSNYSINEFTERMVKAHKNLFNDIFP